LARQANPKINAKEVAKQRRTKPPPGRRDLRLRDPGRGREALRARNDRLARWRRELQGTSTLQERLQLLVSFGLDDRDLVKALRRTGVTERSVRRWRTEAEPTRPGERWDAVDDVCALLDRFLRDGSYDEKGILAWLRSRHVALGYVRPIDAIGAGRFEEVQAVAEDDLGMTVATREEQLLPLAVHEGGTARRSAAGDGSMGAEPLSGNPAHSS
jgi:hypothetical protein